MFFKSREYQIGWVSAFIYWSLIIGILFFLNRSGYLEWDSETVLSLVVTNLVLSEASKRGHERMVNKESGKD